MAENANNAKKKKSWGSYKLLPINPRTSPTGKRSDHFFNSRSFIGQKSSFVAPKCKKEYFRTFLILH